MVAHESTECLYVVVNVLVSFIKQSDLAVLNFKVDVTVVDNLIMQSRMCPEVSKIGLVLLH
jgi:hypothetical protein